MDDYNLTDKFSLWRKWFWIGIIMTLYHPAAGIIYGIAVITEKKRKEGLILIAFSVVWFLFALFILTPWLIKSGLINKLLPFTPGYQLNPPPVQFVQ